MIKYKEALGFIEENSKKYNLEFEEVNFINAVGRVVGKDVKAPISIQPFDNSAMDGFAVKYSDVKLIESGEEVSLNKIGVIAAGDFSEREELSSGNCYHIMTGAPVPKGVDTVVPIELVTIKENIITFTTPHKQGSHIRKAGEDFRAGDLILRKGDVVKSQHTMVLSTLGIDKITVYKKPRALFIATGAELLDDTSKPLKNGQIYNSNKPYAVEALKNMGVNCIDAVTVHDDVNVFRENLTEAMEKNIDIIISSGAVSAGEFDFIRPELESIGAEIIFHKVMMKPGKPNLFAILPNGSLYFGLPGNPVATAVGLRFFVNAAVRAMQGRGAEKSYNVKTNSNFLNKRNLNLFLKANLNLDSNGGITANILDGQASFMVAPFLNMNAWVVMPDNLETIDSGDIVEFYPLSEQESFL